MQKKAAVNSVGQLAARAPQVQPSVPAPARDPIFTILGEINGQLRTVEQQSFHMADQIEGIGSQGCDEPPTPGNVHSLLEDIRQRLSGVIERNVQTIYALQGN